MRRFIFQKALRVLGIIAATTRAFFDFFDGRALKFSHLERDRARKFVLLLLKQRSGRHHQLRALGEWLAPMMGKRSLGGFEPFVDLCVVKRRKFLQFFARGWIDRRDRHVDL